MRWNHIREVGDLRGIGKLKQVHLSRNQIHTVQWGHFPVEIEVIDLSANQIREVGDLRGMWKLKKVNLSGNQIHTVQWGHSLWE